MIQSMSSSNMKISDFDNKKQQQHGVDSKTGGGLGAGGSGGGEFRIHSGQFMVSHFEVEGQEDEDDVLDNNNLNKILPSSELINSSDYNQLSASTSSSIDLLDLPKHNYSTALLNKNNAQVEIDADLSKIFNTLNVTYTQKLTSPKWNPFKGIRLRWKEKIRLNNVIWRCWHMQFVMKKKPLVCQFASPLDVDIHKTPQTIVLEGKYWKRKFNVITAEYKKWRRFNLHRALGAPNLIDTASELDFLEWSPNSVDNILTISDNMSSDTLFSTLSQFPFPDSREIARGAGRADFIQPSLGPLQPNFDDLMDLELATEFFSFHARLPPVPEEGQDEILKAIDCQYPMIGSSQMEPENLQEINDTSDQNTNLHDNIPMSIDHNLEPVQYTAKMFAINQNSSNNNNNNNNNSSNCSNNMSLAQQNSVIQQNMNAVIDSYIENQKVNIISQIASQQQQQQNAANAENNAQDNNNYSGKGKFTRGYLKSFGRREPHNYDKCQPTLHQTVTYNMLLSQEPSQQQQHQSNQSMISNNYGTNYANNLMNINAGANNPNNNAGFLQSNNNFNMPNSGNVLNLSNDASNQLQLQSNSIIHNAGQNMSMVATSQQQQQQQQQQQNINNLQNIMPLLAFGADQTDSYKTNVNQQSLSPQSSGGGAGSSSYKTYHNHPSQQPYKIPSQTCAYNNAIGGHRSNIRHGHGSPPHLSGSGGAGATGSGMGIKNENQTKTHQPHPTKEMFRSNSLPINASLLLAPKEEFIVPKYPKSSGSRLRTRSNSMILKQQQQQQQQQQYQQQQHQQLIIPTLHTSSSEPMLNVPSSALLAQLLTNNSNHLLSKHSISSSAINVNKTQQNPIFPATNTPSSTPSVQTNINNNNNIKQQQQQQHINTGITSSVISTSIAATNSAGASSSSSSSSSNQPILNYVSPPNLSPDSLSFDQESMSSSMSPTRSGSNSSIMKYPRDSQRRAGHIHAEQKRRYNIKNGFDMLHSLIPQLQQNPNAKLSKAAMLQKGAEYIKQLRSERTVTSDKMDALKKEIDILNNSLNHLHTALPANGAPVSRQRTGKVKELYNQYVRCRTFDNWKYWIFGLIFEPMMNSFNSTVSVTSYEEMCRTSLLWVDQHCSLVELRPAISNKLRHLSTTTDILSDPPTSLQEEVRKAIGGKNSSQSPSS